MSNEIVDAINDLTRVTIALQGGFESKSDAVRRLHDLSIPAARIASILAMAPGDVHSAIAKAKRAGRVGDKKSVRSTGEES
jgi:hypothetical protein